MHTFRRRTLGRIVACMLCSAMGSAGADPPAGIVVTFADLDLNTHAGVATLYARLESAARTACSAHQGTSSGAEIAACIDTAVRQAVSRIRAPRLDVLYETRTGHVVLPARR
jgi:UrcA family protein